MSNVDMRAQEITEILKNLNQEIIQNNKFANIFSEVGTLEENIELQKSLFETNLATYQTIKKKNKVQPEAYGGQFVIAQNNLRTSVQEFDKLWIREILPNLKKTLESIQEKVKSQEVTIDEAAPLDHDIPSVEDDQKGEKGSLGNAGEQKEEAFMTKVTRTLEWIEESLKIGEKAGELYSKYGKHIITGIGSIAKWVILLA